MAQETCDSPGVLTRELSVRVLDLSGSGCLIESRRRIEVGTIGRLQLKFGSKEYTDDFEVVRCQASGDVRPVYRVGMRFLWTTPGHAGSIRYAVAHHAAELEAADRTRVM